jgi:hypothetical protein
MKVIYHHNCIDGFTAAWCAWKVYGDSATYIPAQYNEPAPDVTGDDVLIVDFSYARSTLLAMRESAKSLRVLDHHKTAEEDLRGLDFCLFDMNRSGAGIAWDELKTGERPPLVAYVEDRDLWRFALPDSKIINAFIGSYDFSFDMWCALDACCGITTCARRRSPAAPRLCERTSATSRACAGRRARSSSLATSSRSSMLLTSTRASSSAHSPKTRPSRSAGFSGTTGSTNTHCGRAGSSTCPNSPRSSAGRPPERGWVHGGGARARGSPSLHGPTDGGGSYS